MAWNIQAILLMTMGALCVYLGIHTERGAWKESNKSLRKEIQNNYREIENLREIIFHYESRSSRHLNSSPVRDSAKR